MRAKELFGKEVIDANAKVIGKITDIEIDIHRASIRCILVKSGFHKKVSIAPGEIEKIGDKVVLKIAKDKVLKA